MIRRTRVSAGRWALLALLLAAPSAHAVITCSAVVGSIFVAYNPAGADIVTSGTFTITCNRSSGDASTVNYELGQNQGLLPQGQGGRAQLAGLTYRYTLYEDFAATSDVWRDPPPVARAISVPPLIFVGASTTATASGQYYMRISGGQAVQPAGTYSDTISATLTYTDPVTLATNVSSSVFNVNIITNANCTLTLNPTLTFSYTAFQTSPATANVNFLVNCTTGLPYTMTLDNVPQPAPVNVLDNALNLNYSVQLSSGGGSGSGTDQIHQIQGSIPANQAGTCGVALCTNAAATNKTRTLTVLW